jgi:transposase
MKINASVLQGLCFRMYKRHGQVLLNVPPDQVSRQQFFTNEANRVAIMRRAFDITRLETRSRRFACEVKTNGFGASVLLTRLLTEAEAAERAANKTSPRKKRRKTSEQPQENEDIYAEGYRRLPDGYQPEVLIGVDPGKQNVVTAVIVERVRRRLRKRGKRQKQWKRQRKRRKRRYLRGERVVQISPREYRHMAMMNKTRDWHENLKLRERDYAVVIDSLPPFYTAHVDIYLHRLGKLWEHLGFLLEFSAQQAFVRHRFHQDCMKTKALDALA